MILEIVHPNGARTLHRVGALPLSLGRGFTNDLILDDPYVDARHARLGRHESGELLFEDLGSVNGFVVNAIRRHGSIVLGPGDVVRVGRTTLRVHDPDAPVLPALPDETNGAAERAIAARAGGVRPERLQPRWIASSRGRLLLVAIATAAIALNVWLGTADRSSMSHVFSLTLGFLLIAAGWAAIWAAVGRVVVHRFEYAGHFAIVSAVFLAVLVSFVLQEWLMFLFPDSSAVTAFAALVNLALLTVLVALHLALSSALPRHRRWQVGLVTAAAVIAVGAVFALADEEPFSDVPVFSSVIKPLAPKWVPTSTVEEFRDVPLALKREVDAMAAKK